MPDIPFHVVGGAFSAAPPSLVLGKKLAQAAEAPLAPATGSRRRKLWDISHKCHCPIIGTCFAVAELRALINKAAHIPPGTSDYVLHTNAVGECKTRNRLAELLQKHLEKRFQLTIRRFSGAKTSAALGALWREAMETGSDLPAALWAAWTHPACDTELEQAIYGDIHMFQHQIGSGTRADLKALRSLQEQNAELRRQLDKARRETEALRAERARDSREAGERIAELRAEVAGRDGRIGSLTAQVDQLRETMPDLRDRQVLARRASDAEARAVALTAQAMGQEAEIARLRQLLLQAENSLRQPTGSEPAAAPAPLPAAEQENLSGKCVLCVGGRSGAIDAYRQLVEQQGGRFLHHDGGLEESIHRIDAALSAADLVICQAGCISHNAYWRVKEQCKRSGKRCLFLKATGISSFKQAVSSVCAEGPSLADQGARPGVTA